jgi:hypothetical protein
MEFPTAYGWVKVGLGHRNWNRYGRNSSTANTLIAELVLPTAAVTAFMRTIVSFHRPTVSVKRIIERDQDGAIDAFFNEGYLGFFEWLSNNPSDDSLWEAKDEGIHEDKFLKWVCENVKPNFDFQYSSEYFKAAKDTWGSHQVNVPAYPASNAISALATMPKEHSLFFTINDDFLVSSKGFRETFVDSHLEETMAVLTKAFSHTGVTFEVGLTTTFDDDGQRRRVPTKVVIDIPEGGTNNRNGHRISIDHTGATVEVCGYVADEDRFVDDQKRQALSAIEELIN